MYRQSPAAHRNVTVSVSQPSRTGVVLPCPARPFRPTVHTWTTALSGVQPATLALLQDMLARGVIPVVPGQGSVGASGDLAPLAHMACTMIGVGDALMDGVAMPAADALRRAGALALPPYIDRPGGPTPADATR